MFISTLDLFKVGIGPSSSHTMGPMFAAHDFRQRLLQWASQETATGALSLRCTLRGSLAYTGQGHATDRAVLLGLHGYLPAQLVTADINALVEEFQTCELLQLEAGTDVTFKPDRDIVFDRGDPLPQHPNGLIFELYDAQNRLQLTETYFSIGGGFVYTLAEIAAAGDVNNTARSDAPYAFASAAAMLEMAHSSGLTIAAMKRKNEQVRMSDAELDQGLDHIWSAMQRSVESGLASAGQLPGALQLPRRAKSLYASVRADPAATINDWLCAYAMAVNEENAAGHMVVTAPTNGAAGVIPAVLYYFVHQQQGSAQAVREFLLTAAAIGGLIKHRSSISGAEVGCQGEVGSAAAMAAAGLCAVRGGSSQQIENAAEIALEHHLGMTCDPVAGLVQVPCIERNGFGAIKAWTAASLALRGSGTHFMPLDNCIAAMQQTGEAMSEKFKETSLGGLAVNYIEC